MEVHVVSYVVEAFPSPTYSRGESGCTEQVKGLSACLLVHRCIPSYHCNRKSLLLPSIMQDILLIFINISILRWGCGSIVEHAYMQKVSCRIAIICHQGRESPYLKPGDLLAVNADNMLDQQFPNCRPVSHNPVFVGS